MPDQPLTTPDADDRTEREHDPRVQHAYPPPVLPAGTETTAFCGVRMTVGGVGGEPPADACPLCVVAWQQRKRRRG
ncbi:hypothetical protein acdb102_15360 [Acidothermaceae bacterium B102]|nr:hypothetical protein acdb102_15360 [Acidothermaceae bacterium B102]